MIIQGGFSEVSIKFNERPKLALEKVSLDGSTVSLEGFTKRIMFEVQGENGILVRAELSRKSIKKQIAKMREYEDWVATLSGNVARIMADGVIELERAGVTVYEKKKKEPKPEAELVSS